ncbi:MAG: glycosyltransferase [Pseudomonadota bacterium]
MTDQNEIALTVIVPTFNQRAAVCEIVSRLERALGDLRWEAVFIDDFSPDGTADEVRAAARVDTRVRLVSRHDRRGQTSAVVEGALAASTDVIAVIDGDLERDVSILSRLYACVASGEADLALSTVETDLAGAEGEVIHARVRVGKSRMSWSADGFGVDLTDPLDGLFAVRRAAIEGALLERSGTGLAVKLNLIVSEERRPMAATEPLLSVVVPTFN